MINLYYDRIVDGVKVPNGIPNKFVKYYSPNFSDDLFRKEIGFEPAVYPSDFRQYGANEYGVDTIDKSETKFLGYYTIEGFGSAQNAMGVNPETKGKYEAVFNYIQEKSLKLLQSNQTMA